MTKQVSDLLLSNKKNRKTRQEHVEYKMQTGDAIQLEICSFQTWLSSPFVQSYSRVVACVYARAQLLPKLCCLFPWIKILILNCQQYIITSVNVQLNLRIFSCCIFLIILFQSHSIGLRVVCTMIAWNFNCFNAT